MTFKSLPQSSLKKRIDPQMRLQRERLLDVVGPKGFYGIRELSERRSRFEKIMAVAAIRGPDVSRVSRRDIWVMHNVRGRELMVRLYRPANCDEVLPGILYLHGGGMIMGSVAADDGFAAALSEDMRSTVISVEYGLAPESCGVEPVEDCYQALLWVQENAVFHGIDPDRLALFGASAGGGLACSLAMLVRDRGGPCLLHQMLIYPMLDDRNHTRSSHAVVDLGIWDRPANIEAWKYMLGDDWGTDRVSHYVAPARALDLRGLPPTYIEVGTLDLFLDEDVEFAARLKKHGVAVELHKYEGAYHGFDQLAPSADTSQKAIRNRIAALMWAFDNSKNGDVRGRT